MLEMTTDHADALEADLQSQAEALARRSQFIREIFGRYVSEDVVAQLLDAPEDFELGGELRKVTILMSDLRDFTALAECLAPQEVMTFVNRYLEAMVDVILAYRGTIIEILGDGLLVLFGAPLSRDGSERAVACASAMQLRLDATNARTARPVCRSPHGHWHPYRRGRGGPYWLSATHQVWRRRQRDEPHRAH